ncbi:unnamed protein product [Ascophyllum nodosum]
MANSKLTIDLAGRMTTYELRLEVERRGLLEDLGDMDINHATLLRRLVQALVEEEHEQGRRMVQDSAVVASTEQERLRNERTKKKAAAVERSKQRQALQDYFRTKKLSNVHHKCLSQMQEGADSLPRDGKKDEDIVTPRDGDKDEDTVTSKINPRRHKVFVR